MSICIVTPCFNEGVTVIRFLESIEKHLQSSPFQFEVVVVNDGSTDDTLDLLSPFSFEAPNLSLTLLDLKMNVGHQRAIKQGLLYADTTQAEHVIIMDSDGEDHPEAIPELLKKRDFEVVHVVRGKRKEKLSFRLSYSIYKMFFYGITGKRMNFGNYCMVGRKALTTIIESDYVHFAAFLQNQRLSRSYIQSDRGKRIDGKSKMNFEKLIYHAFMSLVENAQSLLMIFFKLFVVLSVVLVFILGYIIYHKVFSGKAILGWASTLSIGLVNLALVSFGFFVLGLLLLNIFKRHTHSPEEKIYTIKDQP